MEETLHTIRVKTGSIEFELTSSPEEVAKARSALEASILAAFQGPPGQEPQLASGDATEPAARGPAAARKRAATKMKARDEAGGERAHIREALLAASTEGFPALPTKPAARWGAYAVLSWANKRLNLDGLTPQEIQ